MEYVFKQAINTFYPVQHRYLLRNAQKGEDFFNPDLVMQPWTRDLFEVMALTKQQHRALQAVGKQLKGKWGEAVADMKKVKSIQNDLFSQGSSFEREMMHIREEMDPVKAAKLILWGQKNRLRK